MFVDASAICAILFDEVDSGRFRSAIMGAERVVVSPIVAWECARAVTRGMRLDPDVSAQEVKLTLRTFRAEFVSVSQREWDIAWDAFNQFGKGRHPAALNMGDCFAYACAVANDLPLLFKGEDFTLTDIRPALPPE